jgi:hypothetical protein
MDIDIVPTLLSSIEDKKSSIELFLASGGAKSYEDYGRSVGEYSSLQKVEQDIKDIEQRFIES